MSIDVPLMAPVIRVTFCGWVRKIGAYSERSQGAPMADKPPDAFLSYTRFDDRHDGGKISEFRRAWPMRCGR